MSGRAKSAVVLIAIAGLALGGFLFVRFSQTVQAPMALATSFASTSPVVRAALGDPLKFGRMPPQARVRPSRGLLNAHIAITVSGSRGRGSLVEWAQQSAGPWKLCSLLLHTQSDHTDVILISESTSQCAREP